MDEQPTEKKKGSITAQGVIGLLSCIVAVVICFNFCHEMDEAEKKSNEQVDRMLDLQERALKQAEKDMENADKRTKEMLDQQQKLLEQMEKSN